MGYSSIPIPTNDPYLIQNGRIRARVSLKHMGQLAGIGAIGINSLLVNPEFGNIFRLGGIITSAPIPSDKPTLGDYCPPNCTACIDACPANAIKDHSIDIISCMEKSVHHPLLKPYALTRLLFRISKHSVMIRSLLSDITNLIINSNHIESCNECMRVCPHFKKAIKKAG